MKFHSQLNEKTWNGKYGAKLQFKLRLKIERELRGTTTSFHSFQEVVQKASNTIFCDMLLVMALVLNYNGIVETQGMVLNSL